MSAARQRKAIRRYQQEILGGRARTAPKVFPFFNLRPPESGLRFAPDRRLMAASASFLPIRATKNIVTKSWSLPVIDGRRYSNGVGPDGNYRDNIYGPPNIYCDPTRSLASAGSGALEDPYNQTQMLANSVAGDVVGAFETGSSAVAIATTNDDNTPAFNFANNGTALSPIVLTTKFSAVQLLIDFGRTALQTSSDRTEFKHNGSAPSISGGGTGVGTGCALFGSNNRDYITIDGPFQDQATSYMKEDSGNIRPEECSNFTMKNFVLRGRTLTVASNPVVYRPQNCTNTILSNFYAYDFVNDGTGSETPQTALFSDQYDDADFLLEHFVIEGIARGPFTKGSVAAGFGGAIRYGIIRDCTTGIRLHAAHDTTRILISYCLIEGYELAGIMFSNEVTSARNVTIGHVTIAAPLDLGNFHGAIYIKQGDGGPGTGNIITNSLLDTLTAGVVIDAGEITTNLPVMNYNVDYRAGAGYESSFNGTGYTSMAAWRTATSGDANSQHVTSDPFPNRASGDFMTVTGAALTAGSTGGEVGCGDSPETVGYE